MTTITYLNPKQCWATINAATNTRDHLLLWFLWEVGPRITEALSVVPDDLVLAEDKVVLRNLKHGPDAYREVLLSEELQQGLAAYIKAKRIHKKERIWPFTRQHAYYILHQAAMAAGLGGKIILLSETHKLHSVSPHRFRDAIFTAKLQYRPDAQGQKLVQQQAGHTRFETTAKYLKLGLADQRKLDEGFYEHIKEKGHAV